MRAHFVSALGILVGLATSVADGSAQPIRVEVGVHAPPVSARITYGTAPYRAVIHPASVWITVPYLARLHRAHTAWMAREQARLYDLRYHPREYRRALRAYERELDRRERDLDRAYARWLHAQPRGGPSRYRH